jgi:hypothetical protein
MSLTCKLFLTAFLKVGKGSRGGGGGGGNDGGGIGGGGSIGNDAVVVGEWIRVTGFMYVRLKA